MYAVSAEVKGLDTVVSLLSDAVLQPRLLGRSTSLLFSKNPWKWHKKNCHVFMMLFYVQMKRLR